MKIQEDGPFMWAGKQNEKSDERNPHILNHIPSLNKNPVEAHFMANQVKKV
jgi:hypothetical protein